MGVLPFYNNTWRLWIFEDDEDIPDRVPTLEEIQTSARRITGYPTLTLGDPVWLSHGRMKHGVASVLQKDRVLGD